ncbi:succinate dehydrogenase cytochrome b556 subunit [Ferrimonas aestuarii]|uniref:Succinate dehydrogenase cytochrome b556 subunit n=1 Tax=Ferrimonas aestuarii TaxID=2569539 RepID=A0A4U1BPL1_9GAMM|nr:succinate dehydrogenase cytochrome b556 subunit [Ferrimonas aestuarii]TKB54488.1 succinate dehydrogenase cytochrome b556 subunit [Ferrimonas aestuarii]
MNKQRPVYLDLSQIQFPATAIASILHRVSGVITFVGIAILMWLLATSLSSEQGFNAVKSYFDLFIVKFVIWGLLTALAYHAIVGVRHLIQDMGHFEEMDSGNASAKISFAITIVVSVLAGVWVW